MKGLCKYVKCEIASNPSDPFDKYGEIPFIFLRKSEECRTSCSSLFVGGSLQDHRNFITEVSVQTPNLCQQLDIGISDSLHMKVT